MAQSTFGVTSFRNRDNNFNNTNTFRNTRNNRGGGFNNPPQDGNDGGGGFNNPPQDGNGGGGFNNPPDNNSSGLLNDYQVIGGAVNNLVNPDLNPTPGSDESRYTTYTGTDQLDSGTNPRTISNIVSSGPHADDHDPSLSGWAYVFGQFTDHDLDMTPGDNTTDISVTVPNGDPFLPDGTTIPLTRAETSSPGTVINGISGWIDASQVYGSDAATSANLRTADGHMKTSSGDNLPIQNGTFIAGDVRVMENPELTANTLLFVREHNFQVDRLSAEHPGWSGDQLYDAAKAITTAELQNIIFNEFLPSLLGSTSLTPYQGYDPSIDPSIKMEFSDAAYRFGHSTVSDDQTKIDNQGNVLSEQTLTQSFSNTLADDRSGGGLDALLRNLGSDGAQATDVYAVDGLRNTLLAPPNAVDLIATDIQRERDVGLGSFNDTRAALGLQPYTSFDQLTSDPTVAANLEKAYGSIDKLDLFMGGLAENHAAGSSMGQTFTTIIANQFEALRDGDRYWWQNENFDPQTKDMISNTTLSDLVMRDTDTKDMQQNAFIATERHSSDVAAENPNSPQLIIGVNDAGAAIVGGPASDTLVAGTGDNQTLTGNGGSDVFIFDDTGHTATITDFNVTFDQIAFHGDAAGNSTVTASNIGGDTTQLLYNGNTIDLAGVGANQLGQNNFTFQDSKAIVTDHKLITT